MDLNTNEYNETMVGRLLIILGMISGGLTLTTFDLYLSILLKFISISSFICYLLVNQGAIKKGWLNFTRTFKKNG